MSENLILDFPVLKKDSGNFLEKISYEVSASKPTGKLKIQHTLKGESFISKLVKEFDAQFTVQLLYRDSSERQSHCSVDNISVNANEITAVQTISIDFSYAPEISPSIVILGDKEITIDNFSGLTDFWQLGQKFCVPKYSRIALGKKLKFTSGNLSKLMKINSDKNLGDGEMKVTVNEGADEGETPVTLLCGQGVYYELHKISQANPSTAVESMRSAIITQALCAVYAYLQNLGSDCEVSGVLETHLEMLEDETGENWKNENFNPSLAATKMHPYAIKVLRDEPDYD